jgi:hypothetical protein
LYALRVESFFERSVSTHWQIQIFKCLFNHPVLARRSLISDGLRDPFIAMGRLGVIQQLRGSNFTQFWTPFPPSRVDKYVNFTILSILCHVTPPWTFYWLPTPSSFPRSYWMPPLGKNKIETTPITLCQILGHDLFCGKSAMLAINMDFSSPRNYSENDRSFAHIPIRKLAFFFSWTCSRAFAERGSYAEAKLGFRGQNWNLP